MQRKPYIRRRAEQVLKQLVAFSEIPSAEKALARERRAYVKRAKQTLGELLTVPLGDLAVNESVVRNLRASVDGHVYQCARSVTEILRAHVGPARPVLRVESGTVVSGRSPYARPDARMPKPGALILPHVRLLAQPHGRSYRFEIDAVELVGPDVVYVGIKEMLLLQALRLVQFVGVSRLQICDCERLFVQVGKRRFCSERCQTRVYMRRFRAGETGKE